MPYLPHAALCAITAALALAACQPKSVAEPVVAEAPVDPTVARLVSEAKAPAFAIPGAPGTPGAAPTGTPQDMLGEVKGNTLDVKPIAPPVGGDAATAVAE